MLDTDICASEPIHIPGLIQPDGYLIAYDVASFQITSVSSNIENPKKYLSKHLKAIFDESFIETLKVIQINKEIKNRVFYNVSTKLCPKTFDIVFSRSEDEMILEFIPYFDEALSLVSSEVLDHSINAVMDNETLESLYESALEQVGALTHFDRIMIYKFDQENNGCVVAEKKSDELESYLGLNYPASDIPAQARELYLKKQIRLISDIFYKPVDILRLSHLGSLDLTYSFLRSVSPIHLKYLENMQVCATLTLSIIIDEKLWGLVACHHQSPKRLSLKQLELCKNIAKLLSLSIKRHLQAKKREEEVYLFTRLDNITNNIRNYKYKTLYSGIEAYKESLMQMFEADGFLFYRLHETSQVNLEKDLVQKLLTLIEKICNENLFVTHCLYQDIPNIEEKFAQECAGILVYKLHIEGEDAYFIWTKKEIAQTLFWGGNPNEKYSLDEQGNISPRESFQKFKQIVQYQSSHWSQSKVQFYEHFSKKFEILELWFESHSQVLEHKKTIDLMELQRLKHQNELLQSLVEMIEDRDAYTAGHTKRVAQYSKQIAQALNLSSQQIDILYEAALLHDVGKVVVPDVILLKPGKLSSKEYELIKSHLDAGYKILNNITTYRPIADIVKYHHEKYDGSGYPNGYKADEIPLESHIMIVADALDAMTSQRIYQARKSFKQALDEIQRYKNIWYHPDVVEASMKVFENYDHFETRAQIPTTEIEEARFSYYYKDQLTDAYNEHYLQMVFGGIIPDECLLQIYYVQIKGMTHYNAKYGWRKGNELIQSISDELHKNSKDAKIIRFMGDDFIICHPDKSHHVEMSMILQNNYEGVHIIIQKIDKHELSSMLLQH